MQGPESGNTEVACQSSKGSQITTGGGFSNVYALPSWQATEVTNYVRSVVNSNSAPLAGYDPTRRGYPDISVLANNYVVAADGLPYIGKITFFVAMPLHISEYFRSVCCQYLFQCPGLLRHRLWWPAWSLW